MCILKRINRLAWRIRRHLSAWRQRANSSSEKRSDPVQETTTQSIQISPSYLPCHPHHSSSDPNFKRPTLLPAFDYAPEPEQTFTLFTSLPPELRLLIWRLAIFSPRIVEMQWMNSKGGFDLSVAPRPPGVLHACYESRAEALRAYEPCFGNTRRPKYVYINLASDVVFFRRVEQMRAWRCIMAESSRTWRLRVRRIAFPYGAMTDLRCMRRTVCAFKNLEELIILWKREGDERLDRGRGANYIEWGPGHEVDQYDAIDSAMRWKSTIEAAWEAGRRWEKQGRKPPIISVRHWCMREMS